MHTLAEEWAQKAEEKYPAWAAKIREHGQAFGREAQLFREAGGPEDFSSPDETSKLQVPATPSITAVETVVPPTPQTDRERILAMPDLRDRTLAILAILVREPNAEEREVLEKKLKLAVLPVRTKSLDEVVAKDEGYFWNGERDYIDARPDLRNYTPAIAFATAINPHPERIALRGSFNQSRAAQLDMIEEYSQTHIAKEFGNEAVAVMLPAIGFVEADRSYYYGPDTKGQKLFRNIFARALDNTSEVRAARAGRYVPSGPFRVDDWRAGGGVDFVGAVPAVVFLRK